MKVKTYLFYLAVFIPSTNQAFSQNLVPNPGFEEFIACPVSRKLKPVKNDSLVISWLIPTKATADYFNKCSVQMNVPNNFAGKQFAHSGNGYAGIISLHLQRFEQRTEQSDYTYREYIQTKLQHPLTKGSLYCIKFYVSLSSFSEYSINNIGLYLSKDRIKGKNTQSNFKVIPQIYWNENHFLDSVGCWTLISGVFLAYDEMQYVTIGNFRNDEETRYKQVDKKSRKGKLINTSYYYIDDVSVELINDSSECDWGVKQIRSGIDTSSYKNSTIAVQDTVPSNIFRAVEVNKPIVLKNIFFDTDKAVLLPASRVELNALVSFLKTNAAVSIQVNGHTDNIASDKHNLVLSEARARAVMDYLIENGIDRNRLTSKGFGSSNPVADNSTDEGRAQNRRVEFVLVKK